MAEEEELPEVDLPAERRCAVSPVASLSNENKMKIVKQLNRGKSAKNIAERYPLDEVLKVVALYEQLRDPELLESKNLLLATGYINSMNETAYSGIQLLLDDANELAEKAELNKHRISDMRRVYGEREEEKNRKIASLEKTLNEERRKKR